MASFWKPRLFSILIMLCMIRPALLHSQPGDSLNRDSTLIRKGRLTGVLVAQGTLYVASLTGLYYAWYKDYPQSSFHLFNDGNEWMQVDKCGHAITAYYISRI